MGVGSAVGPRARRPLWMAGALLVALASAPGLRAVDLPEIQKQGALRVLVVIDVPRPEFFSFDPKMPGFDREVLEGFARTRKLKLEVVSLPSFEDLIPSLLERKGDVIAGGYRDSPTRRKQIAFTDEVFPNRFVIVTLKPHRVVQTVEELRKERVGTTKGTATAEALLEAGVPAASIDDGIPLGAYAEALHAGRITAAAWSVERALPAQRQDPSIQLGMYLGKAGSLAYGVRKEDGQLLAALNAHIALVRNSGGWSPLVVKYFGSNALQVLQQAASQ
jgi:ABC-type amino acid transport substrate-binding protein